MFRSLGSRLAGLGALVAFALVVAGVMLTRNDTKLRESYAWVGHTQQVLKHIAEPVDQIRRAESELRGRLLSGDPSFGEDIPAMIARAETGIDQLLPLTRDNPEQYARAQGLRQAVRQRTAYLRIGLQNDSTVRLTAEQQRQRTLQSRRLMLEVDRRRDEMLAAEQALLAARTDAANQLLASSESLVFFGGSAIALVILAMIGIVAHGIRRPTAHMLDAMDNLGAGNTASRIKVAAMGSREFRRLAHGYNSMAERLEHALERQRHSDDELQTINTELQARSNALHARSEVIELLSAMAHRMQATRTDDEFAQVVTSFVPRVLPGVSGAIYVHNNSRNQLARVATWGEPHELAAEFAPDECWGLRLGQSHILPEGRPDIVCAHLTPGDEAYTCEPLLAGGEVIGLLHLQGVVARSDKFRLDALAENISSALVNHRLQRHLREQTIRDPMTNLFNRRYLEETLAVEVARSMRSGVPLTLVMCDVDHFKRFNDEFGHDAGDAVLQAVANEMRTQFRDGDIVCRFGGEEFTIIAPGVTPDTLVPRIERLRLAVAAQQLRHGGRALGSVSMSFGVAKLEAGMARDGSSLIQAADEALYRAKRSGRNRAIIAEQLAA